MRFVGVALTFNFLIGCISCSSVAPPETRAIPDSGRKGATLIRGASLPSLAERSSSESSKAIEAPSAETAPSSPFRRVLEASGGYVHEHGERRLYSNESVTFDLSTGEVLISCDYTRGYLLSGKNLYFAARMSPYSVCPDAPFLLEYVGKRWELRRFIDAHALLIDEWIQGTTIAAVVPYRSGPPFGYELVKVSGSVAPPRPMKGVSDPEQPDSHCYTELQEPRSLHALPSGALMVVGQSRCDISKEPEGEELSDDERALRYRPHIESFPKGSQRSTLFALPFDEVISELEAEREKLYLLGKVRSEGGDDAPEEMVLVSFDGKSIQEMGVELEGAQQLVLGPSAEGEKGTTPSAPADAAHRQVWILSESALYPAGGGHTIALPPNCQPRGAWFEGAHAWVTCEDGVFTTNPEQGTIEIPRAEGISTCEVLDPRPESAILGLYKKASSPSGCGGRAREYELGDFDL